MTRFEKLDDIYNRYAQAEEEALETREVDSRVNTFYNRVNSIYKYRVPDEYAQESKQA